MIEHKGAGTYKDVAKFYDKKYKEAGYEAFTNQDRKVYLDLLERFGGPFTPEKKILDAGCGHGEFLSFCKNVRRYGIDASGAAVELARKRFKSRAEAVIIQCDLEDVSDVFGKGSFFDYISCLGVIEHSMNPVKSCELLTSVLNPGGILLILVPLVFDDCLGQLKLEENQRTNERFATVDEWTSYFGQPEYVEVLDTGGSKDVALVYRKPKEAT